MSDEAHPEPELKQNLKGWMIFYIVITCVIGSGIFTNGGSAIKIAGPGGALVALVVIGVIAICVAECLSELTQQFPAPNAIVEYVRAFVDKDLGWVVGIAYWFTYASIFAGQSLVGANYAAYWSLPRLWQIILFYIVSPMLMVAINMVGCATFGWVEAVSGILKITLVVGVTIVLFVVAATNGYWSVDETSPIRDGFQHNPNYTSGSFHALCYVIPMIAFGFIGIESVAVTAFEASSSQSLRRPSQSIAYVVLFLYFLCLLSQCLNVKWDNSHLPPIYSGIAGNNTNNSEHVHPSSTNLTIIALWQWGKKPLTGFVNGTMIFSVLSASNTSLYIASRTLYGLALRAAPKSVICKYFAAIEPRTGIPNRALWLSAVSFLWLPFLNLVGGYEVQYLIEIIQISSSISGLIVWALHSLAFLRYYMWLKICDKHLVGDHVQYNRCSTVYKPSTLFAQAQPFPAIIAMAGCLVVFAFCSATWWNSEFTIAKLLIGYTAPIFFLILLILFKAVTRRRWVQLTPDFAELSATLSQLRWYKPDEVSPQERRQRAERTLSPRQFVHDKADHDVEGHALDTLHRSPSFTDPAIGPTHVRGEALFLR